MSANLPNSTVTAHTEKLASSPATRLRNFLIAMAAIALAASLFFGLRVQPPTTALTEMAAASTPLEVAVSNGKPTLMEFYANWCTSCQAMAQDLSEIKQEYRDRLNFVMLNVDNNKWLPEILKYRVDGIPHFVYLNATGSAIAQTIGEAPRSVMEANLEALLTGTPLPHAAATGQVSTFNPPVTPAKASSSDPRSHGSQVQ
ncbi:MAG: thioredoxin family protein [Actinomycetota bacterium]